MTYPSGGPGYPGAHQAGPPSGPHAQTTQLPKLDSGPSNLPTYLLGAVAVLGLASYLLSFGPVWESGASASGVVILGIIAILFAALFAGIGLLPKQANYTPVVAAAAIVGFLLVIWDLIKNADVSGWALIVIVVVSALQTIAAIGTLLLDAGIVSPPAPRPRYDPYQQPYPGAGGYFGQPQQGPYGGPPSGGHIPPSAQPTQTFNQPQGPQHYGGYPGGPPSGGFSSAADQNGPPTPPTGFPTYAGPSSGSPTAATQNTSAPTEQGSVAPNYQAPTQQVPVQEQSSSAPSNPPPS
jgi:hypothetical protein